MLLLRTTNTLSFYHKKNYQNKQLQKKQKLTHITNSQLKGRRESKIKK